MSFREKSDILRRAKAAARARMAANIPVLKAPIGPYQEKPEWLESELAAFKWLCGNMSDEFLVNAKQKDLSEIARLTVKSGKERLSVFEYKSLFTLLENHGMTPTGRQKMKDEDQDHGRTP